MLSAAKRKEFSSAPDWAKLVGDPASRVVAGDAKKSNGKAQAQHQQQAKVQDSDPFAPGATDDDGQIPF
jgi:hypothetical protein